MARLGDEALASTVIRGPGKLRGFEADLLLPDLRARLISRIEAQVIPANVTDTADFQASPKLVGQLDPAEEMIASGDAEAAALVALRERASGLPLHVWGVSSGGYWSLALLSRPEGSGIAGAMFEDVSPHLIEWSAHTAPWGRPFYAVFRTFLRRAYRFLDLRCHAPFLQVRAVAFAGGELDRDTIHAVDELA